MNRLQFPYFPILGHGHRITFFFFPFQVTVIQRTPVPGLFPALVQPFALTPSPSARLDRALCTAAGLFFTFPGRGTPRKLAGRIVGPTESGPRPHIDGG